MAQHEDGDRVGGSRDMSGTSPGQYYADDEISLFDLWDVLVRRWRWIIVLLLVSVLLGLAYGLMRAPVHVWSQTIEIGNWLVIERTSAIEPAEKVEDDENERFVDTVLRSIESPEVVAAKLEEQFVPAAIQAWRDERAEDRWRPQVSVSANSDAGTVVLKGEGMIEQGDAWKQIFADVTNRLRSAHERLLAAIRQQFEVELMRARNRLDDLKQDKRVHEMRLQRLDQHEVLVAEEIKAHEQLLAEAERRREAMRADGSDAALSLVMLANDMRAARERLGQLRIQHEVELPEQRETLKSRIAALERRMETQGGEIEARRLQLESVSPTRTLSAPRRSDEPVGTSDSVVVALSVVLGGMLGVFAAFFVEFVHAANRRRREGEEG